MSRTFVFAGPTLIQEQIQALAPGVEIHPPVAAGDLLRLPLSSGDLVAIIDGYFYQSAAVRHKEILDLLQRGVHVWGAASMGALRAAELAPFGMRGFGRVFEAYVRGEIEGDDEVALVHAPEDMGYIGLTEALVNIRDACECAVAAGVIPLTAGDTIIEVAAALPFFERSYQHILKQAVEKGLAQNVADALWNFVRQERPNLKQRDALELIQALNAPPSKPMESSFEWHETKFIHSWRISDQGVRVNEDQWVSDVDVLTAYQLVGEDCPAIRYRLLLETLAGIAARTLNTDVPRTDDAVLALVAQYIATRSSSNLDTDLPSCMHRWLQPHERTLSRPEMLARLAVRLWVAPLGFDWREVLLRHLKTQGLFDPLLQFVVNARLLNEKLWGQEIRLRSATLPADLICKWFAQRWGVAEPDLEYAMLDRGFKDLTEFLDGARPFYMFDKYVGAHISTTM
ncbi:MAG: TfuA-like protein [Chloroflexota bacterium]|nr:TfuA-like protein [Chloroflexota bacterium]